MQDPKMPVRPQVIVVEEAPEEPKMEGPTWRTWVWAILPIVLFLLLFIGALLLVYHYAFAPYQCTANKKECSRLWVPPDRNAETHSSKTACEQVCKGTTNE